MKISKFVFCLLMLTMVFVYVASAAAPALKFTFKDVIAKKTALETDSYGINKAGMIAGDYLDSAGAQHGMILAGTKLTTIDRKICSTTPPNAIAFWSVNSAGVAAGWCTNTSGVQIGFTWAKGKFTDIKIKGALLVNANGINDKGAVVGTYVDSAGVQHGFLKVGAKITKLDPPRIVTLSTAFGINNAGVITVYGLDSNSKYVSFTTANKGKTYKKFVAPKEGSLGTAIHAPNNKGDIVGTYFDSSNVAHGVLLHGGKYYSFDDPKAANTRADGLNDTLKIVGRYGAGNGNGGFGFSAQAK
jgi:probable HAF family extracellular repeat protein